AVWPGPTKARSSAGARAGAVWTPVSHRPPAGGTGRAVRADLSRRRSSAAELGRSQRRRGKLEHSLSGNRPAHRRPVKRSRATRLAGPNARHLGGEFGRQPVVQGGSGGRDHNPKGFTYFLAGAGVKGGTSYGETDELGHEAVVNRHHLRDLHATILHLMGLDYRKLTYFYGGWEQKLTGVIAPELLHGVLA